jgi:ribosomal protein S27E
MGLPSHKARQAPPNATAVYVRHRPETTLLYQIVQEYWPEFQAELASHGKYLPAYVTKEFDAYLKCGRLEHGFLRVRCESCHDEKLVAFSCKKRGFCPSCGARRMADSAALLVDKILPHQPMRQWVLSVPFPLRFLFASNPKVMTRVLGIVYRTIATHLTHKAGFTKPMAQTGAVTLIQRFGGALNLNIHFHMLFLDGVYTGGLNGLPMWFRQVKAPNKAELTRLMHTIAQRVGRYLERQGLVERDTGNVYLTPEAVEKVRPGTGREAGLGHASDDDPSNQLLGSSITYRIAVGPQQGRKVFA